MAMDTAVEGSALNGFKVLVVDDNATVRTMLQTVLRSAGYAVVTAEDGEVALEFLGGNPVDLILSDVMMPRKNGYVFQQELQKRVELASIPFVFLSSLDDEDSVIEGKQAGADDYLLKPVSPRQLLSVVRGKIERSHNLRRLGEEQFGRYRQEILRTFSHEFWTPIVSVKWGLEQFRASVEADLSDSLLQVLSGIETGVDRLEALIKDFLSLQAIANGSARRQWDSDRALVAVSELVYECIRQERLLLGDRGFNLFYCDHSEGSKVVVVSEQVQDALRRLLENAVKFSESNTTVGVELSSTTEDVVISVLDRGAGMKPAHVAYALEAFSQLDRESSEQQGLGLGLALASGYAAIQGGRLEFCDREGGGSVVSLVLPKVR